jgi:hypothetical protein
MRVRHSGGEVCGEARRYVYDLDNRAGRRKIVSYKTYFIVDPIMKSRYDSSSLLMRGVF